MAVSVLVTRSRDEWVPGRSSSSCLVDRMSIVSMVVLSTASRSMVYAFRSDKYRDAWTMIMARNDVKALWWSQLFPLLQA
jgi:hypothetical protein